MIQIGSVAFDAKQVTAGHPRTRLHKRLWRVHDIAKAGTFPFRPRFAALRVPSCPRILCLFQAYGSTISPAELHRNVKPTDLPVQYMEGDFN